MIFAYAGVKYEEEIVPLKSLEEWKTLKPTFPFEGLPVLEITENGKTVRLAQSVLKILLYTNKLNKLNLKIFFNIQTSIARYLAEKFGIAGKNDLERAQCNMLGDFLVDMALKIVKIYANENMDEKKLAWATLMNETFPHDLKLLQNITQANLSKKGYLVS